MKFKRTPHRILTVFLLILMFFLISQTFGFAAKKDKKKSYVMTEVELQSELMSYADRFASIITWEGGRFNRNRNFWGSVPKSAVVGFRISQ